MPKKHDAFFPRCVDRRHDCHWFMEDGTCALLNAINKHCTFYKTSLGVHLAHEHRRELVEGRKKTR